MAGPVLIQPHWQMTDSMSRFSLFLKTNGIHGSVGRLESVLLFSQMLTHQLL